jgi:hypothetical protein
MRRLGILFVAGALVLGACGDDGSSGDDGTTISASEAEPTGPAPEGIEGVVAYDITDNTHVEGSVDYRIDPPVAGPHNPVWANCKFYDGEIPNENAVHSLEHGSVWITYEPGTDGATLSTIQAIVESDESTHILASEYPGQDSPIVQTAWDRQLKADSIDDPRVEEFIGTYLLADTAPEPGAACSGGAG